MSGAVPGRPVLSRAAAFLLGACVLFGAAAAEADNVVRVLSLPEALAIAAAKNRDIGRAMESRHQAQGRYAEERAAALPQVTVLGEFSRSRDGSQDVLGLGGTAGTRSAQATLSQPLYAFGQIGAAIRAAREAFGTAEARIAAARLAVARDVTVAFYDVLLAKESADIARRALEQRMRHLEETRRRREAGTATDYDVLAAEVAVDNARPDVIRSSNQVRTARERLRFLLGVGDLEVDADGALAAAPGPDPSYDEALAAALSRRPELAEIRSRLGISRELVRIASAQDKPRVDFRSGLGWSAREIGGLDGEGSAWSAGVFVSWPLFDGRRAAGRAAQARSDEALLRIEESRLLDSIALETREAVNAVHEAAGILRAVSGTVSQAERLLALSEKGFEFGVKTHLEVQDAELALRQARASHARARRDYLAARATLDYVTGAFPQGWPDVSAETPWRPAEGVLGIVPEVLRGEPRLSR